VSFFPSFSFISLYLFALSSSCFFSFSSLPVYILFIYYPFFFLYFFLSFFPRAIKRTC
jgi:hypothetical protein